MMQLRKKILVPLLCAGVLLTTSQSALSGLAGTSVPAAADAADTTSGSGNDSTGADNAGTEDNAGSSTPTAEHVTEEEALAEMTLCASSDSLEMYVNEETGTFAVKNLADGHYVWSNPYDAAADSYSNSDSKCAELKSALLVNSVKVTDVDAPSTPLRSAKHGSSGEGITAVEITDKGFKATVEFPAQGITIPYYVTLTDDHFDVSVAINEIHEVEFDSPEDIDDSTRSVVDLGVMANLGAAYADEDGYFVIPDGSGAIINFNNGKHAMSNYSQKMYGKDYAISQDMAPKKTEQAYLPILGIVRENDALLEVITEGAAYATAKSYVSRQNATGYNTAYFEFSVRSNDQYFMGAVNASALKSYEQSKIPEERVSIRYYPIAKTKASYVDVAKRYQQYLLDEGLMSKKDGSTSPLYVDLYGGTVKEQSVLGLPVKQQTAATTYEQAKMILEELAELGVDDIVTVYNDFNKAGLTDRISGGVDYASKLGGKNDFKALKDYCATVGITLVPSVDLMEYERSGNGFSKTGASVIGVTKAYATQGEYELAFGTPNSLRPSWFILTPAYFEEAYGNVISSFASEGMNAISTAKGTSMLYSDFSQNANKGTSRQQAVENLKLCYEKIANSGLKFVTSVCNDYALKYADSIRNVPLYSSGYDLTDGDIPFYEIVIHGYIPYTTKAKNASSDADKLFMLSMATATPMHYEFMYENPNKFTDSKYDTLFYTHYDGWLEVAAEEYKIFKENLSEESNSPIADFKYISDNIVECTFENGTVVKADLANSTLEINGTSIELPEKNWKGATVD